MSYSIQLEELPKFQIIVDTLRVILQVKVGDIEQDLPIKRRLNDPRAVDGRRVTVRVSGR